MAQRAVFLDRDNTIIADPGYLNDPDAVQLMPGAAEAIRRLNVAGYAVVIATNQSGIARGRITEQQLAAVHERMREALLEQGARIDAIYYCPYLAGVEATVPRFRKDSPLRKPQSGMLLRAADEMDLALAASWMIGDSARDITAGRRAGCRTILVRNAAATTALADDGCRPDYAAGSLGEAVNIVLAPPVVEPAESTAPDAATPPADLPPANTPVDTLDATLTELRDLLRRMERRDRQEDFSVARLLATLAQMLAMAAAAWGVAMMVAGQPPTDWLLLAIVLQVMVVAALAMGRH
jgi:D-glycero-D-manno-heptose 1,7-bisphosphate phosphatase